MIIELQKEVPIEEIHAKYETLVRGLVEEEKSLTSVQWKKRFAEFNANHADASEYGVFEKRFEVTDVKDFPYLNVFFTEQNELKLPWQLSNASRDKKEYQMFKDVNKGASVVIRCRLAVNVVPIHRRRSMSPESILGKPWSFSGRRLGPGYNLTPRTNIFKKVSGTNYGIRVFYKAQSIKVEK